MITRSSRREAVAAMALSGLLLWAPLPFGSVTPAAELLFRLAAAGLAAWVVAFWSVPLLRPLGPSLAALAGLGLLGLAQSCSWPAVFTTALSPQHARLYREAATYLGAAAPSSIPLSLDAQLSRSAALSWLTAAGLLLVVGWVGRRARHRRWLLAALVVAAIVQIVVGLVDLARASPAGLALALRPSGRIRGTFANPNHLALLLEVSMAPLSAWSWLALSRRSETSRGPLLAVLPVGLWLLLLVGVILTGSRAGLAAALVGLALQVILMPFAGRRRRWWLPPLVLLMILAGLAAVLASRFEIRRYETASLVEDNLRSRFLVAPAAVRLWRSFPITGTGLGTFEEAFTAVVPRELNRATWNRAHNDPLELLVTGGAVGAGLGALLAVSLLAPALRLIREGRRAEDRTAGLAALGAAGAAGFHGLLDFGLVIPANHLAVLVILGSAVAAESSGRRHAAEAQAGGP